MSCEEHIAKSIWYAGNCDTNPNFQNTKIIQVYNKNAKTTYFHLRRRGYKDSIGKFADKEVDFVAEGQKG